ncbi:alpha-glucosidase [Azospirillum oleiclasticum]|uniref:alpha-glucosidase n=1 Tax=Azospirillum oleiclasticum TaxID=2735135 RepID=UPI001FE51220|nr:alpha-glucosidase [Azospirillum oleiclasticum]
MTISGRGLSMEPWWRGAVLYQIYPRSFLDAGGDGVGDLPGVTRRLDHVAGLGVDGVWLSPFFTSPMKDFGYDVADYRGVDPLFGTLADVDALLERAHGLGLKVIIDMVLSHSSDRHPWFRESRRSRHGPRADWYVWADPKPDGTPPNNWLSCFGGSAWAWDGGRRQYYLHNFLVEQPDLNLHNPAVQDAVLADCAFWLDRGVDGFRLDVANYYLHDPLLRDNPARPPDARWPDGTPRGNPYGMQIHRFDKSQPENLAVLRRLRALLDRYPDRMAVAEVHDDDSVARAAEYVAAPDLLHTAYNFALLGADFGAGTIRRAVEAFEAQPGPGWPSWAFSNHDVPRVASRWGGAEAPPAAAKLLIALLTSLRGTAFLYQGEELGLPQAEVPLERMRDPYGIAMWPEPAGRDGCRTPMPWSATDPNAGFSSAEPWLPIPAEHIARAVDVQEADPASVLAFTRGFLAWRRLHPALRGGSIRFRDAPEPLLLFERRAEGQAILCVFNLSPDPQTIPFDGTPLDGHGLPGAVADGALRLPGWGGAFAALRN